MKNTFVILDTLYKSKSTEVLKAARESDNKPVILKTNRDNTSLELESRFTNEYEMGRSFNSEFIVSPIDMEITPQHITIVFPDDGLETLADHIPENGFSIQIFLNLAIQITQAVSVLHQDEVVHKDINPSNVIVSKDLSKCKLIDFGLASKSNESAYEFTPSHLLQGTLKYVSPEQTGRVNKPCDQRSDLYSLGITFYEMLTGEPPFIDQSPDKLVYAHIAVTPVPVMNKRGDIPPAVSAVIDTCMSKSPEKRYQTAQHLIQDLSFLLEKINEGDSIVDFSPNVSHKFLPSEIKDTLVFRKYEIDILMKFFEKSLDKTRILKVSGPLGVGKTTLVKELYAPVTAMNGFFMAGSFREHESNPPYSALSESLKQFLFQCLQDKVHAAFWKQKILKSVAGLGQLLINLVPEFGLLIESQPDVPQFSTDENALRMQTLLFDLIQNICRENQPVVLFLDNVQWADKSTLSLLKIIAEKHLENLMIVLSYRDDELTDNHPVEIFLKEIQLLPCEVHSIVMKNLTENELESFITEFLGTLSGNDKEFLEILYENTHGNPFHLKTFLNMLLKNNLIEVLPGEKLQMDLESIKKIPKDPDLESYLQRMIKILPFEEKTMLFQLSILGDKFAVKDIDILLGKTSKEVFKTLDKLIGKDLMFKSHGRAGFSQKCVRNIARLMMPEDQWKHLNYQTGLNFLKASKIEEYESDTEFHYIDFINEAEEIITDPDERNDYCSLNIKKGLQLKYNGAYSEAEKYFKFAEKFLPENSFTNHTDMSLTVYIEYGEILYLSHKYSEGERCFNKVINNAENPIDKSKAYIKQIEHYAASHNPKKAMSIALNALRILDIQLPEKQLKFHTVTSLLKTMFRLRGISAEKILNMRVTSNQVALSQMNVLMAAMAPTYISFPEYFPLIVLEMVNITLTYGNSELSPIAWAAYALILISLGKYHSAYEFGETALKLLDKVDYDPLKTKVPYIFSFFVFHWIKPAFDSIELLDNAISNVKRSGDYEFASYAANNRMHVLFYAGERIGRLIDQYPNTHRLLKQFNKKHTMYESNIWHELLITLDSVDGNGVDIEGNIASESQLFPMMEKNQDLSSMCVYWSGKQCLAYLAGEMELSYTIKGHIKPLLEAVTGTVFLVAYYYFSALTCIRIYKKNQKKSLLRFSKKALKKIKKWSREAPENYQHRALLVEAEILSVTHADSKLIQLYEKAIEKAGLTGNRMDMAIGLECMGRMLLQNNLKSMGLKTLHDSAMAFNNWGAHNKARRLQKEYNLTLDTLNISNNSTLSTQSGQINLQINIQALINSIRTLTSQTNKKDILEQLLKIIMENSGATRVIYSTKIENDLKIKAHFSENEFFFYGNAKEISLKEFNIHSSSLTSCYEFPEKPVMSTGLYHEENETLLMTFLIIPLLKKDSFKGILYLENNLMGDAFKPEDVQFLTLLAGQTTIALDNAEMFERLEDQSLQLQQELIKKKESEAALMSAEMKLRSMLTNISDVISVIDINGICRYCSPNIETLFGWNPDNLVGFHYSKIIYPEDMSDIEYIFNYLFEDIGNQMQYECRYMCPDNTIKVIQGTARNLLDNPDISGILVNYSDITQQKESEKEKEKLESQLRQKQKMEAIGNLAGGIAHDFNNILGAISGFNELSMMMADKDTKLYHNLSEINKATEKAANLTHQLLAFSRKKNVELSIIDLNNSIHEFWKMLNRMVGEDILLINKLSEENITVKADTGQIHQIIMNLVVNAAYELRHQSGNHDKRIIVSTGILHESGKQCFICKQSVQAESFATISVKDNGTGMSEEILSKIFDPFFTTKKQGLGTGLGLSTVNSIVQQNNGHITVSSELGKGADFIIYWPIEKEQIVKSPNIEKSEYTHGHATILVIEDEPQLLDLSKRFLMEAGYSILFASSGEDGLKILNETSEHIDLLFTDIILPGMDGASFSRHFKEKYPDSVVLFTSGYTYDRLEEKGISREHMNIIHKPYSLNELGRRIASLLR